MIDSSSADAKAGDREKVAARCNLEVLAMNVEVDQGVNAESLCGEKDKLC